MNLKQKVLTVMSLVQKGPNSRFDEFPQSKKANNKPRNMGTTCEVARPIRSEKPPKKKMVRMRMRMGMRMIVIQE